MDELSPTDCCRLAALHRECLPDSIVSELGAGFSEAFYRYLRRSPWERVFVVRQDRRISSGCVLSLRPATLRRRLLLHTPLLFHGARWMLKKLSRRSSRHAGVASPALPDPVPDPTPEVILIFTASAERGRGAGAALLRQCEDFLRSVGKREYVVRTVDEESNQALRFYPRNGFVFFGQSSEHGRVFRVFKKTVSAH